MATPCPKWSGLAHPRPQPFSCKYSLKPMLTGSDDICFLWLGPLASSACPSATFFFFFFYMFSDIYFTNYIVHSFKAYSSFKVVFRTFGRLCHHHEFQNISSPQEGTSDPFPLSLLPNHPPHPLATMNPLLVSMGDLPVLDPSH